ncbi:MAG TPA: efflux RND transporter periplasmic adaptor subunit [Paludibacter sp.]
MKKNIITIVIIALVLGAAGYKLAANVEVAKNKAYIPELSKAVVVKAQEVVKSDFNYEFTYSGTFIPNREIMLTTQSQGEVKGVYFKEGDVVGQGKLLLQVDDAMMQSQLIAAKASYDNAKTNYERFKSASTSDGVTKMQVDGNFLQMKAAESQLKQLEIGIQKSKLTAPFSGTITMRNVEMGTVVSMSPIARLTDISSLKLEINVPETDIIFFETGKNVSIKSELYPTESFQGKVEFVSDRGDDSHNYIVKIRVSNSSKNKLKAGMYASVSLSEKVDAASLNIPRLALLGSAKKPQVYVAENGKAILRDIVVGRNNGTNIEVLKGIALGEKVITNGQINLVDSCKITLAP